MNSTTPLLQNFSLFNFPLHRCSKTSPKTTRYSSFSLKFPSPPHPLRLPASTKALPLVRCSALNDDDNVDNSRPGTQHSSFKRCNGGNNALDFAKPISCALFYVFIGIFCPLLGFQKPALAAVAAPSAPVVTENNEETGHQYSQFTRRLLVAVSQLLKIIKEARNSGKEDFAAAVKEGLKEVRRTKAALQDEIMDGLYSELKLLKGEKEVLMNRSEEIVGKSFKLRRGERALMKKAKGGGGKLQRLREEKRNLEKEYNDIWERIGEIEHLMERKESIALGIGVRELLSIERECEALVKNFLTELRSNGSQR